MNNLIIQSNNVDGIKTAVKNRIGKIKKGIGIITGCIGLSAASFGGVLANDVFTAQIINRDVENTRRVYKGFGANVIDVGALDAEIEKYLSNDVLPRDSFAIRAMKKKLALQKAIDRLAAKKQSNQAYGKGLLDATNLFLKNINKAIEKEKSQKNTPKVAPPKNFLTEPVEIPKSNVKYMKKMSKSSSQLVKTAFKRIII